jgi:D-3-phosphoglycerate dehydrogenase / 2-oxoglutarate reductase
MPKAVITDYAFDDVEIERKIIESLGCSLEARKSGKDPAALAALVEDADYVITQFAAIDAAIIGKMKRCKVIVRYGIGVDNVDLKAAAARGIPVCNVPDFCTDEVADHALAMILDLCRRITENAIKVRSGEWGLAVPIQSMRSLKDQTVGLVAYGKIGREVALRLKAFKCRILAHDPVADPARMRADGVEPVGLDELLARSDIVSLHCPSVESTRYMINSSSIAKMRKGALLVNVSRGTLVRTDDLLAALRSGHIAAAAMDVTDPEPINPDNPIVGMENVLINSHIASASPQAVLKLRNDAANTIGLLIKGEKLRNIVNGVPA